MPNTPSAGSVTRFKPTAGTGNRGMHKGLANTETHERDCCKNAKAMPEGTYSPKSANIKGGTKGMRHSNDN